MKTAVKRSKVAAGPAALTKAEHNEAKKAKIQKIIDMERRFTPQTDAAGWGELLRLTDDFTTTNVTIFLHVVAHRDSGAQLERMGLGHQLPHLADVNEAHQAMRDLPNAGDILVVVFNTLNNPIRGGTRVAPEDDPMPEQHMWAVAFVAGKERVGGGRECAEACIYDPNKVEARLKNEGAAFWSRVGHQQWLQRFHLHGYTKWFRLAKMQTDLGSNCNILTAKFIVEMVQVHFARTDDIPDDGFWTPIPGTPSTKDKAEYDKRVTESKKGVFRGTPRWQEK
ncbi:hypothetical protein B0H16DRAFT_1897072 [Mycena metata]|uniref:Uncharacterized protein n=1 Tax=Mycena metata TaxID=1033252 RepID=A0AAD7MIY7_9AGAR|nr:hypothetical protein B0H16DRAFT_1897072 [Mycena metata]